MEKYGEPLAFVMVFCSHLDVRGLRLETWKPRKFVLNGSVLRSYVDDPCRGDHERGAYLVDVDTFVTVIHDFQDEPRAKEKHGNVFSLLVKNMNDGYMTTRLTISARDEETFFSCMKEISDCALADEMRNPQRRKSRNYYGTDSTAHLNIFYRNNSAEKDQKRPSSAADSLFVNFYDDAILSPRTLRETPEINCSFNNRISQRVEEQQERKMQQELTERNSSRDITNFRKLNRIRKSEDSYEIKELLLKVEQKKKNNLIRPPFYPPDTHGLPQMYRPILSIKAIRRIATAKNAIRKSISPPEPPGSAYDKDGYRIGGTPPEEGDEGDEGEERVPPSSLDDSLSFDDVEDDRTLAQREWDAEENKSGFFSLIAASSDFSKDIDGSDFIHWVSFVHLLLVILHWLLPTLCRS